MWVWPGFELRVALRFLREGRMQTVLIIVGVAAGVAVIAYISALISGLQSNTLAKTLGAQAHITLRAPDDLVIPAAPVLPGTAALTETQPRAQRLRSVANWQALGPLLERLPQGAGVSPLVSGSGLAGRGGGAAGRSQLDLTLKDVWVAQALARELQAQFPYKIESWQESNAQLVSALNAQSISTSIIRGVVLAVVVLGIASVLVVSVVQKGREIGILRAMGATRGQVLRVFLVQGAVVGALGSVLGLLLAVGLIWVFTHFVRGSDGLPLFSIALPRGMALQIALIASVCGVLAAVAPARRAAALDPAQAIRM